MACDKSLDEFLQGFVADSEMQSRYSFGIECANIASPTFPGVVSKGTPAGDAQPTKRNLSRASLKQRSNTLRWSGLRYPGRRASWLKCLEQLLG